MTAKGFDPIDVVETAYDLSGSLEAWLERLAQAVRPTLDCGYGTQAAVFRVGTRDSPTRLVRAGMNGTPPHMRRFLEESPQRAPREARWTNAAQRMRLWSASELFGSHPQFDEVVIPRALAFDEFDYRDWKAVHASDGQGWFLMVGGVSKHRESTSARERRRWHWIAAHLTASARLAMSLERGETFHEEAVLDPAGKLLHAEGEARSSNLRDQLREHAIRIDRARGRMRRNESERALQFWRALVDGRWSLVDRFDSDGRRFIVALRNDSPYADPRALTPKQRQIAHLASLGLSNKEIAYALGASETTVATHVACALRKLRMTRREQLVGMFRPDAPIYERQLGPSHVAVTSVGNGSAALPACLTSAERGVAQGLLRGLRNSEIADERGVASRTVANQVRSVFEKLDVASRAELQARLSSAPHSTP